MPIKTLTLMASELSSHYSSKMVLLIVFTWVFLTVFHTGDIRDQFKSPKPMYYYTSTNNRAVVKRQKKIDVSLMEEVDETFENSVHGRYMPHWYFSYYFDCTFILLLYKFPLLKKSY